MNYRQFGKLDWEVSALGFGAMRLPVIGGGRAKIDEPEAMRMIRYAIDHGVKYVDTAHTYHSGNSQLLVGKALQDGYRDRVRLATKMWIPSITSRRDMDEFLHGQLTKLKTDHIDFYLLHALDKGRWDKISKLGVLEWAEKAIADGKIRYLGFSFHDDNRLFKEIVDASDKRTFCQLQYNYMDSDVVKSRPEGYYTPGIEAVKYAASKGLAVVIMEPIMGGVLSITPPPEVQAVWDESETKRTPAEWALQWVWNHPEVSVVLSGMSTMQQVEENIKSASRSGAGALSEKEMELYERVKEKYRGYGFIGCTYCGECMPCPEGVDIPGILKVYNERFTKRGDPFAQEEVVAKYGEVISRENWAQKCTACGECEEKCPQRLPIIRLLRQASRIFEREGR